MNNSDFWASVNDIITEDFAPEGLAKLERYAEQFISGQLVYKRFSPHEQHGCAAGGTSHVIATLLAGAEKETDNDAQRLSDFKRQCQCGAQQAERIERWAKNVIKSAMGTIFVIDCDIRINTPELRQGGVRELTTCVEFIND